MLCNLLIAYFHFEILSVEVGAVGLFFQNWEQNTSLTYVPKTVLKGLDTYVWIDPKFRSSLPLISQL